MVNDDYRHRGKRMLMIDELRRMGISDENVLSAMMDVPRHVFSDPAFENHLYDNKAFRIDCGQTISHPYTVAYQTMLLNIAKGEKVLEIGTGSGYQTCVLARMGAKVFSIERQKGLFDKAKSLLPAIHCNARLFYGDGYKGLPSFAPFDKIIVTAGAPEIPQNLLLQMKTGGLMVIPVGSDGKHVMTTILKGKNDHIEIIELETFSFVPMLKDTEK
jgi:protein-L-isoaspartate(D-aspartate) O-methyltransferase